MASRAVHIEVNRKFIPTGVRQICSTQRSSLRNV